MLADISDLRLAASLRIIRAPFYNAILICADRMHTPDQQLHLHGILAPPCRKGAPLHESKESLQIKSQ